MAIKINRTIKIDCNLSGDYTLRFYRMFNGEWKDIVYLSNFDVYVDGKLDNSYDISFFEINGDGSLLFYPSSPDTYELEELLIITDRLTTEDEIKEWFYNKTYFYKEIEEINYISVKLVTMEVF